MPRISGLLTVVLVVGLLLIPEIGISQTATSIIRDSTRILAFAKPWINPREYYWVRSSESRNVGNPKPDLTIRDQGAFQVEFIKMEDDAVWLDFRILQYRFLSTLKGTDPLSGVSELEGKRIPVVWFHAVTGFSIGTDPDAPIHLVKNHQAAQVIELVDFRGFIPKETPAVGASWKIRLVPDLRDEFLFREETTRSFTCESATPEAKNTKMRFHFKENYQQKPIGSESRSGEKRSREGTCLALMPAGLITSATWIETATESLRIPSGKTQQIVTRTRVLLTSAPVKDPASEKQHRPTSRETPLPIPPR